MVNKKIVIGSVVGGVIVLFLLFAIFTGRLNTFSSSVSGHATGSCQSVQVPYQEQEAYEEQEPYQDLEQYQVPLKYEVTSAEEGSTTHNFNYFTTLTVKVRNVDSETGSFTVRMYFRTLKDSGTTKDVTQYIMPNEIKSFYTEYDSDYNEDVESKYTVMPPDKTLTRTVTRYRTVTKYRSVTKYRTEQRCN